MFKDLRLAFATSSCVFLDLPLLQASSTLSVWFFFIQLSSLHKHHISTRTEFSCLYTTSDSSNVQIFFLNVISLSHLYTYTHCTFKGAGKPSFFPVCSNPLHSRPTSHSKQHIVLTQVLYNPCFTLREKGSLLPASREAPCAISKERDDL